MHRISDDELQTLLVVAIKTAPRPVRQAMRKAKLPLEVDKATGDLARHLAAQISNDSKMVISTELVSNHGNNGRPGRWGVNEPKPIVDH